MALMVQTGVKQMAALGRMAQHVLGPKGEKCKNRGEVGPHNYLGAVF